MNLGSIGMIIGHEMSHAYDLSGSIAFNFQISCDFH